jgi:RNA polymerase sigma-70 factor, ECF subfamily
MESSSHAAVTQLLLEASQGNRTALDPWTPLMYQDLWRLAARQMRQERPGLTLHPTALMHESYLKLIEQRVVNWQNRAHFFAIAAQEMRRLLLGHARARQAQKRGGARTCITLEEGLVVTDDHVDDDLMALEKALETLENWTPSRPGLSNSASMSS